MIRKLLSSSCLPKRDKKRGEVGLCSSTCSRLPWGEAGLDPKVGLNIQLNHIVPEISLGWSSQMLGPSSGPGSCAGR